MKLRPVLLLTGPMGPVPEVLAAYISSVIPSQLLPSDMLLDPSLPQFRSTHLKTTSALRLHKLATIHASRFFDLLCDLLELDLRLFQHVFSGVHGSPLYLGITGSMIRDGRSRSWKIV